MIDVVLLNRQSEHTLYIYIVSFFHSSIIQQQRNKEINCKNCPDKIPDVQEGNIKTMMFFGVASNCVRYVSTMENVMVTGIDWVNLKALAELSGITITRSMMKRLRIIESLLIKESVQNARS